MFQAEVQITKWNIKDTFIGVIWNKLKFVEIVMISVSDLAPALAILGVIVF